MSACGCVHYSTARFMHLDRLQPVGPAENQRMLGRPLTPSDAVPTPCAAPPRLTNLQGWSPRATMATWTMGGRWRCRPRTSRCLPLLQVCVCVCVCVCMCVCVCTLPGECACKRGHGSARATSNWRPRVASPAAHDTRCRLHAPEAHPGGRLCAGGEVGAKEITGGGRDRCPASRHQWYAHLLNWSA